MAILTRDPVLQLMALASFLSATVYSTYTSLVIFYIKEHLNVREADIVFMFFLSWESLGRSSRALSCSL